MIIHTKSSSPELERALRQLRLEVFAGLNHGFFDLSVSCELIADRKRRLTIKSGKSYRFVIAEDEVSD